MVYQKQLVVVLAPAKLNLSLDVAGLLPNGYHDLDMVMDAQNELAKQTSGEDYSGDWGERHDEQLTLCDAEPQPDDLQNHDL